MFYVVLFYFCEGLFTAFTFLPFMLKTIYIFSFYYDFIFLKSLDLHLLYAFIILVNSYF